MQVGCATGAGNASSVQHSPCLIQPRPPQFFVEIIPDCFWIVAIGTTCLPPALAANTCANESDTIAHKLFSLTQERQCRICPILEIAFDASNWNAQLRGRCCVGARRCVFNWAAQQRGRCCVGATRYVFIWDVQQGGQCCVGTTSCVFIWGVQQSGQCCVGTTSCVVNRDVQQREQRCITKFELLKRFLRCGKRPHTIVQDAASHPFTSFRRRMYSLLLLKHCPPMSSIAGL